MYHLKITVFKSDGKRKIGLKERNPPNNPRASRITRERGTGGLAPAKWMLLFPTFLPSFMKWRH